MFKENLKYLKLTNKLTNEGMAEKLGIGVTTLYGLTSGRAKKPSNYTEKMICESFHVSKDWLYEDHPDVNELV